MLHVLQMLHILQLQLIRNSLTLAEAIVYLTIVLRNAKYLITI
jgi:hypothetical protein